MCLHEPKAQWVAKRVFQSLLKKLLHALRNYSEGTKHRYHLTIVYYSRHRANTALSGCDSSGLCLACFMAMSRSTTILGNSDSARWAAGNCAGMDRYSLSCAAQSRCCYCPTQNHLLPDKRNRRTYLQKRNDTAIAMWWSSSLKIQRWIDQQYCQNSLGILIGISSKIAWIFLTLSYLDEQIQTHFAKKQPSRVQKIACGHDKDVFNGCSHSLSIPRKWLAAN